MLVGIISYGIAILAFLTLSTLLISSRQTGTVTTALISCCFISLLWAIGYLVLNIHYYYLWVGALVLDPLRIFSWATLVNTLLNRTRFERVKPNHISKTRLTNRILLYIAGLTIASQLVLASYLPHTNLNPKLQISVLAAISMIAPLTALYLLEQLYISTKSNSKSPVRYLIIGLAIMFLFDFVLIADTMLFKQIRIELWQVRGLLYSTLVPLVALTVARNPSWAVELHVSRKVVTTSVTFIGAGAYLVVTAFAASLIRIAKFENTRVIFVSFVVFALLTLTIFLLSKKIRAKLRVSISKHFFNFKYDYRTEWLKFTNTLSNDNQATPKAVVQGFIDIVDSNAGVLWCKDKNEIYSITASLGMLLDQDISSVELNSLERFLEKCGWIIDVEEYRKNPAHYEELELPTSITDNILAWLIIPLPFQEKIEGYVMISKSEVVTSINWEDRDLLKTAGRQAAGLLAQRRAHQELKETSQFAAYSKLSAYIVHDLKNILGQQSLIVSNAPQHKHNPDFIDDVIATVDNSVNRMQSLLQQLREPSDEIAASEINLKLLLKRVVDSQSNIQPSPILTIDTIEPSVVMAVEQKLIRVFKHIVQNAQEATDIDGSVTIYLVHNQGNAKITVVDTGSGMSEEFIQNKLFAAFVTTKGLTGMGIGVFESREYIRSLGGDIVVESKLKNGSEFKIYIPLAHHSTSKPDNSPHRRAPVNGN